MKAILRMEHDIDYFHDALRNNNPSEALINFKNAAIIYNQGQPINPAPNLSYDEKECRSEALYAMRTMIKSTIGANNLTEANKTELLERLAEELNKLKDKWTEEPEFKKLAQDLSSQQSIAANQNESSGEQKRAARGTLFGGDYDLDHDPLDEQDQKAGKRPTR